MTVRCSRCERYLPACPFAGHLPCSHVCRPVDRTRNASGSIVCSPFAASSRLTREQAFERLLVEGW